MTIHSFMNRWEQLFSWLYYRHQWEAWELLAVAGVVLLLLMWAVRKQRNESEARARALAHPIHQNPPIIGARLAARSHGSVAVTDPKRHRLVFLSGNKNGRTNATEPSITSSGNTGLLPQETAGHQQTEAYLQRRLDELKTTSEKLQNQNSQGKQTEERLRRRMARLLAAGKKLRQDLSKLERSEELLRKQANQVAAVGQRFGDNPSQAMQAREHPRWSPLELLAPGRLSRGGANPQGGDEETFTMDSKRPTDTRRASEPLDVEKLKAIAALARRIQSRPRRA